LNYASRMFHVAAAKRPALQTRDAAATRKRVLTRAKHAFPVKDIDATESHQNANDADVNLEWQSLFPPYIDPVYCRSC